MDSCKSVSNFVTAQDETIYEQSGNRALEVGKLRQSLVAQRKYNRASKFMQLELTLVQDRDMKDAVGAAYGTCSVMEQTQKRSLLFRSATLWQQISGLFANVNPQMSEQASQCSSELLKQVFPRLEALCPGISFDHAVKLVRHSPATEGEKSRDYISLFNVASERRDFTRANQTLIAARNAAEKNWHQCKTLPSGHAALQHLHDVHTAYIDLHQKVTGMSFFESAGVADYMTTLSVHYKNNYKVLEIFEDFQGRSVDFEIPIMQERMFDLVAKAAQELALITESQQYTKQYFKWLKQCPFSDQWGQLTMSALSDPDQYLRQIFNGAQDPTQWGINAMELILAWAKNEAHKSLLASSELVELFGFLQGDERGDNSKSFLKYIEDLDFEDAARCFYGDLDKPTPSVTFLDTMQRLKDWLNLPDRPPSQAARLGTAKIILISRLHRHRLDLARKGFPKPTDSSEYSEEQKMLDVIEKLEHAVGGGFGDQPDRQTASRIQNTLTKCYVPGAVTNGLISDEELQSRISDCMSLVSKYGNGGRRLMEYHSLLQQSRLQWQRYLHFGSLPPDSSLDVLEKAELLFNDTRRRVLTPDPADLFPAVIELSEEFMSQEHSKLGIMASFKSFLDDLVASRIAQGQGASELRFEDLAFQSFERFLNWTHRSKGRGLIDLLYFDFQVVQDVVDTVNTDKVKPIASGVESNLPSSVQNLDITENIRFQVETGKAQPSTNGAAATISSTTITGDAIALKTMINEMLSKVGNDVVLVDIINIAYLDTDGNQGGSQALLYRKGSSLSRIPLPNLKLQTVERWVKENLDTEKPLCEEGDTSALQKLTPLLMPLFDQGLPQSIKAKETVIFCLTGALHRIPLHAIPINGVPLIESQPVAYCQSLTTLYQGYEAVSKFQLSIPDIESLAIVPSYEKRWTNEEMLLQQIEGVSRDFNTKSCVGSDLIKETVRNALSDCAHVLYFGHVHYDSGVPIRSAWLLNESAFKNPSIENTGSESLSVRDLFKTRLHKPALATIIGCSSGRARISHSDDILGLPSALLFAGASAIVSTLWTINAEDGARFAAEFYHAYRRQQETLATGEKGVDQEPGLKSCVNLARAMHEAVNILRQRDDGKNAVYHWAAFYLSGFWLFPPLTIR